jgi:hypothetical protein
VEPMGVPFSQFFVKIERPTEWDFRTMTNQYSILRGTCIILSYHGPFEFVCIVTTLRVTIPNLQALVEHVDLPLLSSFVEIQKPRELGFRTMTNQYSILSGTCILFYLIMDHLKLSALLQHDVAKRCLILSPYK